MWNDETKARMLNAKRIGKSTCVKVEVEDLVDALDEIERLRGLTIALTNDARPDGEEE